MKREKRALVIGLVAATASVWLLLNRRPTPLRDLVWAGLLLLTALSIAEFERRGRTGGRYFSSLRWVAMALAVLALALILAARSLVE
jgi:hypothetical protein